MRKVAPIARYEGFDGLTAFRFVTWSHGTKWTLGATCSNGEPVGVGSCVVNCARRQVEQKEAMIT
jgi:hypothetical protein